MLLKRVRITASACPNTHFTIASLPALSQPSRVWTSNGFDNRRAAGKWNQLDSLAPQPVAAATATQGTYGQLYPLLSHWTQVPWVVGGHKTHCSPFGAPTMAWIPQKTQNFP